MDIPSGLAYVPIRPYTDDEWESLSHVIWTLDIEWGPSVLDHALSSNSDWYSSISDLEETIVHSPFDEFGNYKYHTQLHPIDNGLAHQDLSISNIVDYAIHVHNPDNTIFVNSHQFMCFYSHISPRKQPDYNLMKPVFLFVSSDIIKRTFDATTHYARSSMGGIHLKKTYQSPFPA